MDLTFDNWLSGDIELDGSYKNNIPEMNTKEYKTYCQIKKSIDLFPKKEKIKIAAYQKKYFAKLSKEFINKLYSNFKVRYDSSKYPLRVLETELFFLDQILSGEWAEDVLGVYINNRTNITMFANSYSNFENYISRIKTRNFKAVFDFMPGPNSKFYKKEISVIPEIYADVLYDLKEKLSRQHSDPSSISLIPKEFVKEPKNKYPKMFANGWAYRAFIIIEEIIAVNEKTYNADYALIYYCLQFPDIQAIEDNVDKEMFSEFINKRLNGKGEINASSMRKSTSIDKNRAIRYGIKFYVKRIGYNGDIQKLLKQITL